MQEIFRTIPKFNSYKAGTMGNIYSLHRNIIMKQYKNKFGYMRIKLYDNGNPKNFYVHRLIAITFICGYKSELQVNHKNGIKSDNRLENLEMLTRQKNIEHSAFELGNSEYKRGSPLSNSEKRAIHRLYKSGKTMEYIADLLCVSIGVIHRLLYSGNSNRNVDFSDLLIDGEIVVEINGFDGYYISNYGNVYSKRSGKKLNQKTGKGHGYAQVFLSDNGKRKLKLIHRLVAENFLDRPVGIEYIVHHKNSDRTDNRLCNLKWVTYSENNFARFDK